MNKLTCPGLQTLTLTTDLGHACLNLVKLGIRYCYFFSKLYTFFLAYRDVIWIFKEAHV